MEHPPGTGQSAEPLDWAAWYSETSDALLEAIGRAAVEWGESPEGEPYIILGQQRGSGYEYPLAMVLSFRKVRQGGQSDRDEELHEIETGVTVFDRADPRDFESNLQKTQAQMGAIESALYADRSLGGTCENLWVTESTALELTSERGDETAGDVQIRIQKEAKHPY